jgi:imidazole glycerol phosphate synthase glutamine amidotransferase subunit
MPVLSKSSGDEGDRISVALAPTGVANLASVLAALRRAGAAPFIAADPEQFAQAPFALVPGVGSFGSAVETLRAMGMDEAIKDRITRRSPTMGICAGMQVFFESSEESPGAAGLSLVQGRFGRFPSSVPVPQLGWNRVTPDGTLSRDTIIRSGWAYFANSYRILDKPEGFIASRAVYGDVFIAALESEDRAQAGEGPALLLCQFHPELSGPWGLDVYKRWLGLGRAKDETR